MTSRVSKLSDIAHATRILQDHERLPFLLSDRVHVSTGGLVGIGSFFSKRGG